MAISGQNRTSPREEVTGEPRERCRCADSARQAADAYPGHDARQGRPVGEGARVAVVQGGGGVAEVGASRAVLPGVDRVPRGAGGARGGSGIAQGRGSGDVDVRGRMADSGQGGSGRRGEGAGVGRIGGGARSSGVADFITLGDYGGSRSTAEDAKRLQAAPARYRSPPGSPYDQWRVTEMDTAGEAQS